jgi:hypothetical protein
MSIESGLILYEPHLKVMMSNDPFFDGVQTLLFFSRLVMMMMMMMMMIPYSGWNNLNHLYIEDDLLKAVKAVTFVILSTAERSVRRRSRWSLQLCTRASA